MQLQQLLQNPQQFKTQFDNFARNFQQGGQNPQAIVQQLLNSGQMNKRFADTFWLCFYLVKEIALWIMDR